MAKMHEGIAVKLFPLMSKYVREAPMVVLWWCYDGVVVVLWWCYDGIMSEYAREAPMVVPV
jgi:hypothetical protein